MIDAVCAVRNTGMGLNKAAKIFNVPKTSLRRYVNMKTKTPEEVVETKSGRKPVFSAEMEKELVEYVLFMETRLFGLTRQDVRKLAFQLATKNNLKNEFSHLKGIAGKDWLHAFLNRHKDTLSLRSPTGTSFARANGFNKASVNNFFDLLESEVEKQHFDAHRIYNVDKSGLTIVATKVSKVLSLKGRRQAGSITSAERGSLITVVICMSAGGT
jgi:transposase